jgi:uncharacterized protein YndB with AHSA1/START domain
MRFEAAFSTAKPVQEVFDWLSDWEHEALWNSWARWVRKSSDGAAGKGTVYRADFQRLGEMDEVISEFSPPRRLAVTSDTAQAVGTLTIELEEAEAGTRGRLVIEMAPRGIMRLVAPVMLPMMMPRHVRDMAVGIQRELARAD